MKDIFSYAGPSVWNNLPQTLRILILLSSELMVRFFFSFLFSCFSFLQTEFSLLADYHKPKHTLKMHYCYVNSHGHSNGSKFNLMLVWMVSSAQLKTLVTELGSVIHHHEPQSPSVLWNVCFAVFKVKVRVTAKVQNVIDCLPG